jgi:hypothetical protein
MVELLEMWKVDGTTVLGQCILNSVYLHMNFVNLDYPSELCYGSIYWPLVDMSREHVWVECNGKIYDPTLYWRAHMIPIPDNSEDTIEALRARQKTIQYRKHPMINLHESFLLVKRTVCQRLNLCASCFRYAPPKTCTACHKAKYCSRKCQADNWSVHKTDCKNW